MAREGLPMPAESLGQAPGRGRLIGRRILVVGGGQRSRGVADDPIGNGRAMCLLYAREGASVAVADMSLASAEATVDLIANEGGQAIAIEADIRSEAEVIRMVKEAAAAMGGLDGLVCNAGIGVGIDEHGIGGVTAVGWDDIFAVNARGPALCCREALTALVDGASIVLISSIAALRPLSGLVAYDASKAALEGLLRSVGAEAGRRRIRANIVYPGIIDTPIGRAASDGRPGRNEMPLLFGRKGTAWEVAYATLFFLSDESAYVTGQTLAVDSGYASF